MLLIPAGFPLNSTQVEAGSAPRLDFRGSIQKVPLAGAAGGVVGQVRARVIRDVVAAFNGVGRRARQRRRRGDVFGYRPIVARSPGRQHQFAVEPLKERLLQRDAHELETRRQDAQMPAVAAGSGKLNRSRSSRNRRTSSEAMKAGASRL